MTETKHKKNRTWTDTEKETHKEEYGTEILIENGTIDECNTRNAPTDASIVHYCLLYTSPSPRDATLSRMPSSA